MVKLLSKKKYDKVKYFFEKNANRLSILFFIGGFVIDNLTLTRIDAKSSNLILVFYLLLSFVFIWINNIGDYKGFKSKILFKIYEFSTLIIQFAFGALFSGYVIYYSRSSSFLSSWPFLILLYLMFIGNEKIRKFYERFRVQISIFYFALFSFLIFYIPILFGKMNNYIFIFTGLISLAVILIVVRTFFLVLPNLKKYKFKIWRNILFIFIVLNLFYFNHLLPPVPISVKKIEVLHYADRNENGKYQLAREKRDWTDVFDWWNNVIHWKPGERIYVYASVFAPTDFKTHIKYMWYWYDPKKRSWVYKGSYTQKIVGGRENGFRSGAYMQKAAKEGDWRLDLLSEQNAVIDSLRFKVVKVDHNVPLEIEVLD